MAHLWRKVLCYVLSWWDLPNWGTSDCILHTLPTTHVGHKIIHKRCVKKRKFSWYLFKLLKNKLPSGYYYKYTHKMYFSYFFLNCWNFGKLKLKLSNLIFYKKIYCTKKCWTSVIGMILLKSSQQIRVHWLGFIAFFFRTCNVRIFKSWMIFSLKIKLHHN